MGSWWRGLNWINLKFKWINWTQAKLKDLNDFMVKYRGGTLHFCLKKIHMFVKNWIALYPLAYNLFTLTP